MVYRIKDVCRVIGRGSSAVYEDVANGLLTRPVRLGARASGWPEHEVEAILALRVGGADDATIKAAVRQMHVQRETAASRVLEGLRGEVAA